MRDWRCKLIGQGKSKTLANNLAHNDLSPFVYLFAFKRLTWCLSIPEYGIGNL